MFDWSFLLTLAIIVTATLIGSYLRSTAKDRCLKDFDGFHVTVEKKNGRVVWGEMSLTATGFELIYRSDFQDDRHVETSYLLYKTEYPDIQAIYRFAANLDEEKRRRRAESLQRAFHPSVPRRWWRSFRNFLNTARDSLSDGLGLLIGRVRQPVAQLITDTSENYLKGLGKNIIGYAGTSYDPLLERYVGSRVVVEVVEGAEVHEHVGVLKEYSADFLELLDVYYPMPQEVHLRDQARRKVMDQVEVVMQGGQLKVRNTGQQPAVVDRISIGERVEDLDAVVAGGEEIVFHVEDREQEVSIRLRVACHLDMIVPRSHALVRHRAERYDPDTIFDIGLALVRLEKNKAEIERLRQRLHYAPHDAIAAGRLGDLLYRHGEWQEAYRWLRQAYEHRRQLPDGGQRVAQKLRLVERHLDGVRHPLTWTERVSPGSDGGNSQASALSDRATERGHETPGR